MTNLRTTLAIFGIAAAIALVLAPALTASVADAVPVPKQTENCKRPSGVVKEGPCPGGSASAGPIVEQCQARNPGQEKKCPPTSEETTHVNPQ